MIRVPTFHYPSAYFGSVATAVWLDAASPWWLLMAILLILAELVPWQLRIGRQGGRWFARIERADTRSPAPASKTEDA